MQGKDQHNRYFSVSGRLMVNGQVIHVGRATHAADLPPGMAAEQVIAERVRMRLAHQDGDPGAAWVEVQVMELPTPAIMFEEPVLGMLGYG